MTKLSWITNILNLLFDRHMFIVNIPAYDSNMLCCTSITAAKTHPILIMLAILVNLYYSYFLVHVKTVKRELNVLSVTTRYREPESVNPVPANSKNAIQMYMV